MLGYVMLGLGLLLCSASLHGPLQPGALTLLTVIISAVMMSLLYLFHLTSSTALAHSLSETTHETGIRQDDKAQRLSALTSLTH